MRRIPTILVAMIIVVFGVLYAAKPVTAKQCSELGGMLSYTCKRVTAASFSYYRIFQPYLRESSALPSKFIQVVQSDYPGINLSSVKIVQNVPLVGERGAEALTIDNTIFFNNDFSFDSACSVKQLLLELEHVSQYNAFGDPRLLVEHYVVEGMTSGNMPRGLISPNTVPDLRNAAVNKANRIFPYVWSEWRELQGKAYTSGEYWDVQCQSTPEVAVSDVVAAAPGANMYVCRGILDTEVLPGSRRADDTTCLVVAQTGADLSVAQTEEFEVLTYFSGGWVPGTPDAMPVGAVLGGVASGVSQHICRGDHGGVTRLGRTTSGSGQCLVESNGRAVALSTYDVLVNAEEYQAYQSDATAPEPAGPGPLTDPVDPDPDPDPTASMEPLTVTNFENFGTWRRGDETWATFTQSGDVQQSGGYSGKIAYDFPAVDNNYVVFLQSLPILGQPDALAISVYGDGSTHFLNAWVRDANGAVWQVSFGRINHTGWQMMVALLDLNAGWPNGHVSGPKSGRLAYPLQLHALVLDGYTSDQPFSGIIYVDDLAGLYSEGSPAGSTGSTQTATTTQTQATTQVAPNAQEPALTSAVGPALVTNFESFGTWRRGHETWGTFTQSNDVQQSGKWAGKIVYDFPAVDNNYVVFLQSLPIPGQPTDLTIEVYGDSSTHFLNAWIRDANGAVWQMTFGRIEHSAWQTMVAPLDPDAGWPNGHVSGPNSGSLTYPLQLHALVLDSYTSDQAFNGTIYVDDLEALYP